MKNMNLTLKQALDAAGIQGEEREAIIQLLQKREEDTTNHCFDDSIVSSFWISEFVSQLSVFSR